MCLTHAAASGTLSGTVSQHSFSDLKASSEDREEGDELPSEQTAEPTSDLPSSDLKSAKMASAVAAVSALETSAAEASAAEASAVEMSSNQVSNEIGRAHV